MVLTQAQTELGAERPVVLCWEPLGPGLLNKKTNQINEQM